MGAPSSAKQPEASDRVRGEWLRRIEAEYQSAAITQHLGLWLIQIGAPPDLIADALRIVGDEMTHAELSHAVYVEAGGRGAPNITRETLALPRSRAPLEHDVLRSGVSVFCLGETVAVRLFKGLRKGCTVPVARRALDRILKDEVRHRDFGWTLLEWLVSTPSAGELRRILDAELPAMLRRVERNYVREANAGEGSVKPAPCADADRKWGLMSAAEYTAAVRETIKRDYAPRFSALDVAMPK